MTGPVPKPAPLVPVELNLRDFPFMPLDVARVRRSKAWLKCKKRPELGFYMLNLWMASWHDLPAASLEDDDDVLADLAICSPARWAKVKDEVLHGWVKCSDGRLYHPVVAEKANEGWAKKQAQRARSRKGNAARWGGGDNSGHESGVGEEKGNQQQASAGRTPPQSQEESQKESLGDSRKDSLKESLKDSHKDPKGEGEGEGQREGLKSSDPTGLVPGSAGDAPGQRSLPGQETEAQARERRLSEVVKDALETYNVAPFTKAHGGNCPNIQPSNLKARDWVKRAIEQIRAICLQAYGSKTITRQFWIDYWAAVDGDPFSSGRKTSSTDDHANWVPDFEFLTRPARIAKMFDLAMSSEAAQ